MLLKNKREFSKEYCRKAKRDIKGDFGFIEGMYVINKLGSKQDLLLFILLYWGWDGVIRKLLHRKEKTLKENKAIKN